MKRELEEKKEDRPEGLLALLGMGRKSGSSLTKESEDGAEAETGWA